MICSTCLKNILSTPPKTTAIDDQENYNELQKEVFRGTLRMINFSQVEHQDDPNHWAPVNRIYGEDVEIPERVRTHIDENEMLYIEDRVTERWRPGFADLILEFRTLNEIGQESLEKQVTEAGQAQLKEFEKNAAKSFFATLAANGGKCPCPRCKQLTLDKGLPNAARPYQGPPHPLVLLCPYLREGKRFPAKFPLQSRVHSCRDGPQSCEVERRFQLPALHQK